MTQLTFESRTWELAWMTHPHPTGPGWRGCQLNLHPAFPGAQCWDWDPPVQTHQIQNSVGVPGQLGHLGQGRVLPDQDLVL